VSVRVKICGITRVEDADAACALGADFIGINFYDRSPRCVSADQARRIKAAVAGRAQTVGVFMNATREFIETVLGEVGIDLIQFHGDEDHQAMAGWPVPVIRALRLGGNTGTPALNSVGADYVLLDSFDAALFGGTGRALKLEMLKGLDLRRVFIAGGLNAENVAAAAALKPFAVDVASGVESSVGVKDHLMLRSFVTRAKSA